MFSLADAILQQNISAVKQQLLYANEVNELDEYGFTPLIEAAIVENIEITQLLLASGAQPNQQDVTGGTALQWAVENNNIELAKILLENGANPNTYNFSGQPVLVMPILRQQSPMRQLLIKAGADLVFAQDFINTKLLGHMFELIGTASIVSPKNEYVEVDFEGFYLEVTVGIVADTLVKFQNHFAARQLRRYSGITNYIHDVLQRASQLIKYQQYRIDTHKHLHKIDSLIKQDPLIIPVGYEGHAITFVRYGHLWVKCDRREDSRLYDNVMIYRIGNTAQLTEDLIKSLIYVKQSHEFINIELDNILGLVPLTEIKVDAQISGNCSWANVEATIPAMFYLILMSIAEEQDKSAYYKTLALNFFHRWREWNKDRALNLCIQSYHEGNSIRKAAKAELLAAVLFQRCDPLNINDKNRIDSILSILINSPYEYLLRNYLRVYYYERPTDEGKRFFDLLKDYGFKT